MGSLIVLAMVNCGFGRGGVGEDGGEVGEAGDGIMEVITAECAALSN